MSEFAKSSEVEKEVENAGAEDENEKAPVFILLFVYFEYSQSLLFIIQ
jgi:hypothetical protein